MPLAIPQNLLVCVMHINSISDFILFSFLVCYIAEFPKLFMSSFFFLSPLVRLCHTFAEQTRLNSLYPIQSSSKILRDFKKIAYSRINSVMCSSVHFDNYIELPQYHTKLFLSKTSCATSWYSKYHHLKSTGTNICLPSL